MEPTRSENLPLAKEHRDIDLGLVIYKLAQYTKRGVKAFGRFVVKAFRGLLFLLLFLKQNLIWLGIGAAAVLGYGIFTRVLPSYLYSSTAVVRVNYGSSFALYNAVDYINALIGQGRTTDLSNVFSISVKEAAAISRIEIKPVDNYTAVADIYQNAYLRFKKNELFRQDSVWLRLFTLKDYQEKLTKYDYPLQEIKAICSEPELFAKLQEGLLKLVVRDESLQYTKTLMQQSLKEEVALLERSSLQLDSLSSAIAKGIEKQGLPPGQGNSYLNMISGANKDLISRYNSFPEIELFNTKFALKNELASLRAREAKEHDLLVVYAPFNTVGLREVITSRPLYQFAIAGFLLSLAILLAVRFFRFLTPANIQRLFEPKP